MVDFSTRATDINAQIQPDTQVLNPVTREGEINALNQIGKGLGTAVRVARTAFDNQATLDANKRLAGFSLDLSRLQDAEAQGLSTAEVQTRARRRLQQELANNPNAEQDILQRYSTWQSQSGYNKISTPDIQAAEIKQAQIKTAVDNGFLSADQINNPAAAEKAIDDLENFQRTVRELEMSSKEIANKSSKIDLAGKEKAAAQAEAEQVLTNGLAKVANAALPYWRTQYENIKGAAAKATTEQERQQILKQGVIQLEQDFAQRTASMSGDTLNLPQAKIDQVLKPQKDLIEIYKKELSGEYDADTVKRQVELVQNRTKLMVWEGLDDDQKRWIGTAEILGPAAVVLQNKLSTIVVDMFQKNGSAGGSTGSPDERGNSSTTKPADLTYGDPKGKANVKNYLDGVTKGIDSYNSGQYDKTPEQKAKLLGEIDAQMKGILKGVNVYANSTESADQFQPLIDFFANPTVGEYLRSSGGIPASVRGEVARVFQDGYQKEVIPLLQNEIKAFDKTMIDGVEGKFLDFFQPTMTGNRFSFELKPEFSNNPSRLPIAQQRINSILRNVNNSSFTKVLNKMIISDSHIQGTDDYNKSYETIAPLLFGAEGEQKTDTQEKSSYVDPMVKKDELSLADFDTSSLVKEAQAEGVDTSTLEGDVKEIAQAIDIGEAGGDYGTLLGFTHRPGRKFDDVNITDMTINELLKFAEPGGAYGDYSKRQVGRVATPMGRYQIVGSTLRSLTKRLGLTGEEKFTPEMQDKLFLALLRGRGYDDYKAGKITKQQLVSNLQSEWEGLSKSKKSFNALVASL